MFTLKYEKSRFYRVKRGQSAGEVSHILGQPVEGELYGGMIIPVDKNGYKIYTADEGETFSSLSEKFGVSEEKLKKANGGIIYPSRKLFIPL